MANHLLVERPHCLIMKRFSIGQKSKSGTLHGNEASDVVAPLEP